MWGGRNCSLVLGLVVPWLFNDDKPTLRIDCDRMRKDKVIKKGVLGAFIRS